MKKTNALRLLDSLGIAYRTYEYSVDESDLSGTTVAHSIGADPDTVFKTLVARGDVTGVTVFCLPVTAELHLKAAATASGNKSVQLIKLTELLPLTGYVRGGCSPLAMKKHYPVFLDETAQLFDVIYVSAGIRGMQVQLPPNALCTAAGAVYAPLL